MPCETTWEEKLAAFQALGDCSLKMRSPGDWYVSGHLEWMTPGSGMLEGKYGNGKTPEEVVLDHWEQLTDPKGYLVIDAMSKDRRHVKWNGYMWEDTPIKVRER
jgi:hypothetical protein